MKKILVAAAMAMMSVSAFANYCEVDMVDYRGRFVLRVSELDYDNTCRESMKQCRKLTRTERQYSGNNCVKATVSYPNPRPYPDTNPYPNPRPFPETNPYPQYSVTVSALIEDKPFEITARDASELYVNCLSEIRRVGTSSSDELFFTVNGNRYKSTSTSGWYNDSMICSIFEQEARRSLNITSIYAARIVGSLENLPFRFEGYDRANLLRSCIASISSLRLGTSDEMTYSLNGQPFQRMTTSGWWQTPASVCKAMLTNMDPRL